MTDFSSCAPQSTRQSFEREVDRLERINQTLRMDVRVLQATAAKSDTAAAQLQMRNLELQAALKQSDVALAKLDRLERREKQLSQVRWNGCPFPPAPHPSHISFQCA